MNYFSNLCCSIVLLHFACCNGNTNHPVILVPGNGGSQIEAKLSKPKTVSILCSQKTDDYFTLWLNGWDLMPKAINCWTDNMLLQYDEKTHMTFNNDGVETRVPGFGNTTTVEYLGHDHLIGKSAQYYHAMAEALVLHLGYQRGINLHGAPYDFRKAANEQKDYFDNVVKLIESTYELNGGKSVILVTHSMGSTMMLYMLNHKPQDWKDKYIRAHISIAGVWAGTIHAMKIFAIGDNLGSVWVNHKAFRKEQRSNPSLNWLMPNLDVWSSDKIFVKAENINITKNNFEEFYKLLNSSDGLELWKNTKNLIKELTPPGVELYCIYSYGMNTTEQLVYKNFPDGDPVRQIGDGDGTVNIRSLEYCKQWSDKQSHPVITKSFERLDHNHILMDKQVVEYVKDIVKNILQNSSDNIHEDSV